MTSLGKCAGGVLMAIALSSCTGGHSMTAQERAAAESHEGYGVGAAVAHKLIRRGATHADDDVIVDRVADTCTSYAFIRAGKDHVPRANRFAMGCVKGFGAVWFKKS